MRAFTSTVRFEWQENVTTNLKKANVTFRPVCTSTRGGGTIQIKLLLQIIVFFNDFSSFEKYFLEFVIFLTDSSDTKCNAVKTTLQMLTRTRTLDVENQLTY